VTVSEFMFLAIGLVLGVASGAALIEIIRARPPAGREVRVTVAQDAIPRRRATTLADDAFVSVGPEPARGGPADRRTVDAAAQSGTSDRRTNVLEAPPGAGSPDPPRPPAGRLVGVPVSAGPDPMMGALRAVGAAPQQQASVRPGRPTTSASARDRAPVTPVAPGTGAVALLDPPAIAAPAAPPVYAGPCAAERRLADERCELATLAQAQADSAGEALRRTQRTYDARTAAAETAAEAAHPMTVRTLKEDAQRAFRAASKAAGTPDAVEAAARAWLHQINQINREAAGASLTAEREWDAANAAGARLERLALDADAARIRAEMASTACVAARTAVADCDERGASATPAAARTAPAATPDTLNGPASTEALGAAIRGGGEPRIFRLLAGDDVALEKVVGGLGGDDEERRRWERALATLVDAIRADAIEGGFLRFPDEHVFWGPYTIQQNRDIARALGSLGHRFDGHGGWVDDHVPTQRELSLALGYAGQDPMRVRQWPSEAQVRELYRNVDIVADEYLAGVAGDLTLAEMVEMLGRRADGLVELWNQWGRIRPLLLEES
jgi:hypothetical protein